MCVRVIFLVASERINTFMLGVELPERDEGGGGDSKLVFLTDLAHNADDGVTCLVSKRQSVSQSVTNLHNGSGEALNQLPGQSTSPSTQVKHKTPVGALPNNTSIPTLVISMSRAVFRFLAYNGGQ